MVSLKTFGERVTNINTEITTTTIYNTLRATKRQPTDQRVCVPYVLTLIALVLGLLTHLLVGV